MHEVWMLDYLNAIFPEWGVFESERHARIWVMEHDPEQADYYTPFKLTVNKSGLSKVPTTSKFRQYTNQR
jgi:hypothetical protein